MLKNLLVVAASSLIALAAGEVAVRALLKDHTVMFPRYHTGYQYGRYSIRGIRPNAQFRHSSVDGTWKFVTNSRGFRDRREFEYAKAADTLRVLSLGDSHTQGYEVRQEATFSAVLERYLVQRGIRAEVLNAGVSGFSNAEALAFLENEGYKFQPDVVVLGFSPNDFEDNLKAGLFGLENGRLLERKYQHLPGVRVQDAIYALPGVRWLSENSYLYSLAFNGVWTHFRAALGARAAGAPEYAVATRSRHGEGEVALATALIERMQAFCRSHGARFIVVEIPNAHVDRGVAESPLPVKLAATELVTSRELLGDFDGAAEVHVPHGHRHISELTHALIGVELGRRIAGATLQRNHVHAALPVPGRHAASQE